MPNLSTGSLSPHIAFASSATGPRRGQPLHDDGAKAAIGKSIPATTWLEDNAPWVTETQQPIADGQAWPLEESWTVDCAAGVLFPDTVTLKIKGEDFQVLPMWICVHQHHQGASARLYESICPLDDDTVNVLTQPLQPFCMLEADTLVFTHCDEAAGSWRNYFIGIVGSFSADEDDVLWPNQVLHRRRTKYNVRNGLDLANFLADPRREDYDEHVENLVRLETEKGYHKAWKYHALRARWGDETLSAFGADFKGGPTRVS